MAKVGIVIVTYNTPVLLPVQLDLIAKYCKDDYQVEIFDNSFIEKAAVSIMYHAQLRGAGYTRTKAKSVNSSVSATFALNVSFVRLRDKYDYFLYLDHDAFPLREFSVIEELGDSLMAGLGQQKAKMYMHTGFLMFNNKEIPQDFIDFSCNDAYQLDTGGNLYRIIEKYPDRITYWDEEYEENPYFTQGFYNFYSMINKGMFMHFINGAGWNKLEQAGQNERINSLLNILHEKTA
jgi:hypothetical protein